MEKSRQRNFVGIRTIAVFIVVFGGLIAFSYSRLVTSTYSSEAIETAKNPSELEGNSAKRKYSEFPHSKHKQTCSSCHKFPSSNWKTVRKGDAAFPDITDYPKHESCLSCHKKQFYTTAKPVICSICHTNPSPRNSSRHPFPNPRELFDLSKKGKTAVSDFAISFPHDKHIEIVSDKRNPFEKLRETKSVFVNVSLKRAGEESCSVCHQTYKPQGDADDEYFTTPPKDLGEGFWLKKGTFKTKPIGHTTCFTCHSTDVGILPAPSDCAVCHSLKPKETNSDFDTKTAAAMNINDKIMLDAWRKRDSSAKFRHEWSSHAELDCANCHNVQKINTLDAATKKVDIMSCAICHITDTSDDGGILNYEIDERKKDVKFNCTKCHLAYGKSPIPETHLKAIPEK